MQKLSRINKYKEYRNKLNNDSEKEIATRELKELQEKIIFNEKRFGNSSRTESDLNRGRKDSSYDSLISKYGLSNQNYDDQQTSSNEKSDNLDDIFSELNKYKTHINRHNYDEENDDYIKRIKEIVNISTPLANEKQEKKEEPIYEEVKDENIFINNDNYNTQEDIFYQSDIQDTEIIPNEYNETKVETQDDIFEDVEEITVENESNVEPIREEPVEVTKETDNKIIIQEDNNKKDYQSKDNGIVAEFEEEIKEEEVISQPSQIQNVVLDKPEIKIPIPKDDLSKEFTEICETVNTLTEEIDSSNTFAKEGQEVVFKSSINKSLENIQNDINKDLMNNKKNNEFMSNLQDEVEQYNKSEDDVIAETKEEISTEEQKHVIKKSEVSGQLKEEYDNTVSLEVSKIMDEINSSRTDNISANDVIKHNNVNKKNIEEDQAGKTIAFEYNKNKEIPDNTIILSEPNLNDSSIHTMSFKTEDLDIENADKGSTLLNIILGILIIIAVAALGIIIYFFLITRGII